MDNKIIKLINKQIQFNRGLQQHKIFANQNSFFINKKLNKKSINNNKIRMWVYLIIIMVSIVVLPIIYVILIILWYILLELLITQRILISKR